MKQRPKLRLQEVIHPLSECIRGAFKFRASPTPARPCHSVMSMCRFPQRIAFSSAAYAYCQLELVFQFCRLKRLRSAAPSLRVKVEKVLRYECCHGDCLNCLAYGALDKSIIRGPVINPRPRRPVWGVP